MNKISTIYRVELLFLLMSVEVINRLKHADKLGVNCQIFALLLRTVSSQNMAPDVILLTELKQL